LEREKITARKQNWKEELAEKNDNVPFLRVGNGEKREE
jgi:hypothetical protein